MDPGNYYGYLVNYLNKRSGALDNQIYETMKGTFVNFRESQMKDLLNDLPEHLKRKEGFILNTNRVRED